MANFQAAPSSLLKHVPTSLSAPWQAVLKRPGTYSIFDENAWRLIVPNLELGGDKGVQSRLIGMWGGQDGGHRLDVRADPAVDGLKVELVAETPAAPHLWLWCVSASVPKCLVKAIDTT